MTLSPDTRATLKQYAEEYETAEFINGDPSWFMHQVSGDKNQETIAFLAAALSYGSRKQFLPKIENFLIWSGNEPYQWVKSGLFNEVFQPDDKGCYYRLYNKHQMWLFLNRYEQLLAEYGSLKAYLAKVSERNTLKAIDALCTWFGESGTIVIPRDTKSACKRLCMFMRWMVRDSSPVDTGIWADIINKDTLIIPLDTHVLTEAVELGLISSRNASMQAALKLTDIMRQVFPADPARGDFALFGYGVNKE